MPQALRKPRRRFDFLEDEDFLDEDPPVPAPADDDQGDEDLFRTIDQDQEIVEETHAQVDYRSTKGPLVPWEKPPAAPQEEAKVISPRFGPKSAAG
jgi:hypothetical protein